MKIFIGSDHAAFDAKSELVDYLRNKNFEVVDLGPDSSERCNYPDFATSVAKKVVLEKSMGILLCGSGIGVSMVANRYAGIRAALCRTVEEAKLSREHNDSNILCFGARISSMEEMKRMVDVWPETEFGGGRHEERIALFNDLGEK